jgi:N-acetylneuraminic acid mutarotase
VAGGANFPGKRPWEGGTKVWYDSVFVLENPGGQWKTGFRLPHPLGYGVSLSHRDGVICLGGSDSLKHYRTAFTISWLHGGIEITPLPELPQPCANFCGAILNDVIYVAGGLEKSDSSVAMKTFWTLDLRNPAAGWRKMEPWPGPERMLATAAAMDGKFFLVGGAAVKRGLDGKVVRDWLRDGYCFTPDVGWKPIAEMPRAAVAAPSPAPIHGHELLILGGDDGAQVDTPPLEHRGFPRDILAYDAMDNSWRTVGQMPFALVTTPAVNWNNKIVVADGEARPGIRSPSVWMSGVRFQGR